jgi:hypothetical protein
LTKGGNLSEQFTSQEDLPFFGGEPCERLAPKLSDEELEIITNVYELAFDQVGCRMI